MAADVAPVRPLLPTAAGITCVAQRVQEVGGRPRPAASPGGIEVGRSPRRAVPLAPGRGDRRHRATPGGVLMAVARARTRPTAAASVGLRDELQRPVVARPEALGQQVVGLARGRVGRVVSPRPPTQAGSTRTGSRGSARALPPPRRTPTGRCCNQPVQRDHPPTRRRCASGPRSRAALAAPQHLAAEEAEQRRQQRQRRHHRERDRDRRGDRHARTGS